MNTSRITQPGKVAQPRPHKSGRELAIEGAGMLATFYPDPAHHAAAARRLDLRARRFLNSGDPSLMDVGFFVLGLANAMKGKPNG